MASSISTPQNLRGSDPPVRSTSGRNIVRYPTIRDVSIEGDTSLAKKDYTSWVASSSTQNEAQTGVRQPAKRPYLRRSSRRLPARTFPPPARPQKFKILPPSPELVPAEYDAASPMAPSLKPKTTPTGTSLAYQFQNGGAYQNDGEETQSSMRVRTT
jgi:hypothetical protein